MFNKHLMIVITSIFFVGDTSGVELIAESLPVHVVVPFAVGTIGVIYSCCCTTYFKHQGKNHRLATEVWKKNMEKHREKTNEWHQTRDYWKKQNQEWRDRGILKTNLGWYNSCFTSKV